MFVASSHVSPTRNRLCPRCQDYALRVRRRLIDRILHPFVPVRRYQCMSTACGWVGNLKPGQRMPVDAGNPAEDHQLEPARGTGGR